MRRCVTFAQANVASWVGRRWLLVLQDGTSNGFICEGSGGASLVTTFGAGAGGTTLVSAAAICAENRNGATLGGGGGSGVQGEGCSVALWGRDTRAFRIFRGGGIYGFTGRPRCGAGVSVMRPPLLTEVVRQGGCHMKTTGTRPQACDVVGLGGSSGSSAASC